MPATVTTKPTYAVPNRQTTVIFTPADGATNYIRVWATTAPEGTAIRKQIDKDKLNRALVHDGPGGADHPWRYVFEKGGAYSLTLQEYTRGNAWGGGYENDPRGAPSETKNGGEQSLTLYISQRFTMNLGTSEHSAKLLLYVHTVTVVPTLIAVHGVASPAIIEPTSERATNAAAEAAVAAATTALAGKVVTNNLMSAGTSFHLKTIMTNFRGAWAGHLANNGGTYHDVADTANVLLAEYAPTGVDLSPDQAAASVSEILRLMRRHFLNDNGEGVGSGGYHPVGDADNLPMVQGVNDVASSYAGFGDALRAYAAHIANSTVHSPADATNVVTTIGVSDFFLLYLHQLFMTALASTSATAGPGESIGGTWLIQQAGMVEG